MEGKGSYDVGNNGAPVDKFRLIYLIFGWLGIGTLLPWNMFITVNAYWDDKWQTVNPSDATLTNVNDTGIGKGFSPYYWTSSCWDKPKSKLRA